MDEKPYFPPDPRLDQHKFRAAHWNAQVCSYCSKSKSAHHACGHAVYAINCETCTKDLFSESRSLSRRLNNLTAMRDAGIAPKAIDLPELGGPLDRCKHCRAEVRWVTMRDTGAKQPLDVAPHPKGNIAVVGAGTAIVIRRSDLPRYVAQGYVFYRSHFATCRRLGEDRKRRLARPANIVDFPGQRKLVR